MQRFWIPLRRLLAPRFTRRINLWGLVRVATYGFVVSLCFSLVTLRAVLADGRESALRFGRDLVSLADVLGAPQLAVVNGVRVFVGAQHVDLTVDQVLNRFDRYCQQHSGQFESDIATVPEAERGKLPVPVGELERIGIVRVQKDETEGVVACLAAPDGFSGVQGFVTRMAAVVETGDLARLGSLRYVFAKKSGKLGSNVITIWNEGPVNLLSIFPAEGDVPGQDIDGVTRPPGSTRVFDAQIAGTGYGMHSYATRDSESGTLAGFEKRLTALGWRLGPSPYDAMPGDPNEGLPDDSRAFTRDGAVIFVSVEKSDDETLAHVVTMATRGDVEVQGRRLARSMHDVDKPPTPIEKGQKP